jgi:Protein of unknown function (DUF3592)
MEAKLIIGGVAILGLVLGAIGAVTLMSQARFRRRARTAPGVITGLRATRTRGSAGEPGSQRACYPTVRFITAAGQEVEAESRLPANPPPGRPGQQVTVRYDPADPRRFATAAMARTAGLVSVGFVITGGLVFAVSAIVLLAVAGS